MRRSAARHLQLVHQTPQPSLLSVEQLLDGLDALWAAPIQLELSQDLQHLRPALEEIARHLRQCLSVAIDANLPFLLTRLDGKGQLMQRMLRQQELQQLGQLVEAQRDMLYSLTNLDAERPHQGDAALALNLLDGLLRQVKQRCEDSQSLLLGATPLCISLGSHSRKWPSGATLSLVK